MANSAILPVGAGLIGLLWHQPALAQYMRDGDWGWHSGSGWGHMMVGGLAMIVFWVIIVALGVLIVRGLWGGRRHRMSDHYGPSALDELRQRFARGEIDETEYRDRKRVLSE